MRHAMLTHCLGRQRPLDKSRALCVLRRWADPAKSSAPNGAVEPSSITLFVRGENGSRNDKKTRVSQLSGFTRPNIHVSVCCVWPFAGCDISQCIQAK